jgi:hypothetical protein
MKDIKLPKNFKFLKNMDLFRIVEEFIEENKKDISERDFKKWSTDINHYVPSLFIKYAERNGFIFPKNSLAYLVKSPPLVLLNDLIKQGDLEKTQKASSNDLNHICMARTVKPKPPSNIIIKINKCEKLDCTNINNKICSVNPVNPLYVDDRHETIKDCLRYYPKEFKFKNRSEALIVFSNVGN